MLRSLFLLLFVCVSGVAMAQTSGIAGVLKDERGEPVTNGSVTVTQGGISRGGAITDIDGNFVVKPLDAGRYDVKFSYQGVEQTVTGVIVSTDAVSTLNHKLVTARDVTGGKPIVVTAVKYAAPLIDARKPGGRSVKTSENIEKAATTNLNDIATLSTQSYQSKNNSSEGVSLGGGRVGSGTLYVVDGVQLASGNASFTTPPQGSVDQVATYVSGIPARYGDASGGVITITTKGVSAQTRAGIRLQHSIDGYNNNLGSFNLSGPLFSRRDSSTGRKHPVLGYAVNGQLDYNMDPNPSYYKQYHLNDAKQSQLEQSPLTVLPGSSGDPQTNYQSETVRMGDLEQRKRRENVESKRGGFNGKLVYALNDKVTVTAGGEFYLQDRMNYSADNVLFNYDNNSQTQFKTGRGYIRLSQKFANASESKNNAISNAFYTVQADYQKDYSTTQDKRHKHNTFDYGYVGKFDQQYAPSFSPGVDDSSGFFAIRQTGYTPTGIGFTRDEVNPLLANYTSQYYQFVAPNRRPNLITISDISRGFLRNGDAPTQVYGQFNNAGTPYGGWNISNNDQVAVQVDASFDLKHNRTTHSIEFGLYYQQRNERFYGLTAVGTNGNSIWNAMRLLELSAVDGSSLDFSNPTYRINGRDYTLADIRSGAVTPGPNDTVFYTRLGSATRSAFDRNLREKLGKGKNEYINIDGLDRSTFGLDMFAPDELTIANQPFVRYYGYDHTGKRLSGQVNFNDYWTQKNAQGDFTRPIGAYRPNYIAGYLSDYIQYKDFLISLGVRVERFDANTKVLRDPYSFIATRTVGEYTNSSDFKANYPNFQLPANISSGYIPYVGENSSVTPTIIGYRNGEQWYDATGTEVQDPLVLNRTANVSNLYPLLQRTGGNVVNISDSAYSAEDANKSFVDYKPKVNVMPRINFSFPLNENALFYAHYDVMVQRPTTGNYATAADYRYLIFQPTNIIDNPDLKPEKLIDYEVGFQQKLTDKSSVTISGFYKERKDQIQIRQYYQAYPTTYFTYGNRDFSTTKGFSLNYELRRINNITMSVNYTLSFNEGTGSSAASANGGRTDIAVGNGLLANYIGAGLPNQRNLFPLDYDSRHNINAQIDYRYLTGEGPSINGVHFLENAGANLIFLTRSGEPYTRYAQPTGNLVAGAVNASRLPWHFMFNLNVDKTFNFKVGKQDEAAGAITKMLSLNVFLYVQNLFNTRDVLRVYGYTGRAGDDGYLTSAQGINQAVQQVDPQSYRDIYGLRKQDINQLNNPRTIVLGVKLNF